MEKRIFMLLRLHDKSDATRMAQDIPGIQAIIKKHAKGDTEIVFRSAKGHISGMLFKTTTSLKKIYNDVDGSTFKVSADHLMLFEVGEDFIGSGFGRAAVWLQRN